MSMEYSFTEDDVWAYLATKQDGEEVGVCGDATACLIGEAMRAKYPELAHASRPPAGVSVGRDGMGRVVMTVWGAAIETQRLVLSFGLSRVMRVFDFWTGKALHESVTKREFLEAWWAFAGENGCRRGDA